MKIYSVDYIPTSSAFAFIIYNETITIRAFERASDAALPWATDSEIENALNTHGKAFHWPILPRNKRYPLSVFEGVATQEGSFVLSHEICWQLDPAQLGVAAVSDRAAWMFMFQRETGFRTPFNRTLNYLPARANKDTVYASERANAALTICQPYADSSLKDCTFFLKYNAAAGYFHKLGATIHRIAGTPSPSDVWPRIRLTGPKTIPADGFVTVTAEILHPEHDRTDERCNSTLFLEDVSGYTPHRRAVVKQGLTEFRVGALGLGPGETVRVKTGWRNWPGDADYIAKVT